MKLFGRRRKKKDRGSTQPTAIQVHTVTDDAQRPGSAAVRGSQVAIWRPPVMLDAQGRSLPGVSKDLIARYLVATTAAISKADLGPVSVEWKEQQGRFCLTEFTIHAWGQSIDMVHPVAPVSQDLADTWDVYKGGLALKVRELHKGHQRYDGANRLLERAVRRLEQLRDAEVPHFSDAEYLFLQAAMRQAMVMSALVPVSETEAEDVVGTDATVA
jgi:hypothetical protein